LTPRGPCEEPKPFQFNRPTPTKERDRITPTTEMFDSANAAGETAAPTEGLSPQFPNDTPHAVQDQRSPRGGSAPSILPAERFMQLLGKEPKGTWFGTLKPVPGKGSLPNVRRGGTDLHGFDAAALAADNQAGEAVYFRTGDSDQATGKNKKTGKPTGCVTDADITLCRAVFVEWDDRPIDWQVRAWQELGLPDPTAMVITGGKSVHCYWRLAEPMAPDEWRVLQKRLIDYAGGDTACKNPSRLMRLPGFHYIDKSTGKVTDNVAELIHQADVAYSAAEIEACIPAPQPATPPPAQLWTGELPPRSEADLLRALERVPEFFHKQGRRLELLGLAQRLTVEWGADRAHSWLAQHSPTVKDLAGYFTSEPNQISAGSIWPFLHEHYDVDLKRHDLKRSATTTPATPPPAQQQDKPPASLQALIQRLPDGWSDKRTARPLSPGGLADMLTAQSFQYNELDLRGEVETSSGWQRITDADMDSAYVVLTGKGWKIGPEAVVKAILHVARQNTVHPVRDYLQRVKADPSITPYDLDEVAPNLFRASQPLHVAMVRKWLIGAVARALKPGCQMDYCLVLKGGQGLLKSTGLKALTGGEWFTSTHADGDKDFLQNVHSCWVYELAELESITNRKQAGALKNLITTATDVFRPPYGRTPERTDRQSVFCATVNKDQFLRDDTGNRRFWVVPIEGTEQLDREAITAARDAIWKAAVLAHEAGELPMLSKELEALSAAQNEEYNEQDAWTGMVQAWMDGDPLHRWDPDRDPSTTLFDPAGAFSSAEILYSAGLKRTDAITRADEMRLAEVLRTLGFTRKQRRVRGAVVRLWSPSQPSQPVPTSKTEVVTPQNSCTAVDLPPPSQPSQPKKRSEGLKRGREGVEGAAPVSPFFETRGCDTPISPARSLPAQSVYPVTTSLSQPPIGRDTPGAYEVGDLVDVMGADRNWRNGFRVLDVVETSAGTRYRVEGAADGYNVTGDQLRPSVEAA